MPAKRKAATKDSSANLGFEAKLWLAADKLRNNMDAAEPERSGDRQPQAARRTSVARQYKHVGSPEGSRGGANQFGVPPKGNANFAWVQHFIHHLAPQGMAGFVLANGSMSSNQSGEGEIRQKLIEADLVDCMVALPGQLFYSTQIPVCLWFLAKNKGSARVPRAAAGVSPGALRNRKGETLFIDARKLGTLIDRVHRELTDADLQKIVTTYHLWRGDLPSPTGRRAGDEGNPSYADVAGFCKSATTAEIAAHGHVLTPGRYVGAEEIEDDGEPFEEKMPRLVAELHAQFAESAKLEQAIQAEGAGLWLLTHAKKETPVPVCRKRPRKGVRGQRAQAAARVPTCQPKFYFFIACSDEHRVFSENRGNPSLRANGRLSAGWGG
jgi:hypothetical protein